MIPFLRHLIGWIIDLFRSRQNLVLAVASSIHQTTSSETLVGVERVVGPRDPKNGRVLASSGLPAVLEMAFTSPTRGRQKPREPGDPGLDLPHGVWESNLGSATHSRRVAQFTSEWL